MEAALCSICHVPGVDVCFSLCQCQAHARCLPVDLILSENSLQFKEQRAVAPGEKLCPVCHGAPVTSIRLLPLSLENLEKAVELRSVIIRETQQGKLFGGFKDDGVKMKFQEAPAEAPYLLLSHAGPTGRLSAVNDYQRTGRWTDEEMAYTDFLVECFDAGNLLVEPDTKLGDFLGEVLLCKSSRLTKKMKHAKLSVRSYNFCHPIIKVDVKKFSKLEQNFLDSVPNEHLKLELGFHLTRLWRSHLASLCMQIKSELIDFTDWFKSLEEMEHRALEAENSFRKIRRQGLNHALLDNVVPNEKLSHRSSTSTLEVKPPPTEGTHKSRSAKSAGGASSTDETQNKDFISDMLDLSDRGSIAPGDDYHMILDKLVNDGVNNAAKSMPQDRNQKPVLTTGSFLNEIASFMESQDLPFVCADLWVPSLAKDPTTGDTPLLHAGFVSRTDVSSTLIDKLNEFGHYSSHFSFSSGVGLPGKVLQQGRSSWEHCLNDTDPRFFEYSEDKKRDGIKSGLGLCLSVDKGSRLVVCLYSDKALPEDSKVAAACLAHLTSLRPVQKWIPTVELTPPPPSSSQEYMDSTTISGLPGVEHDGSSMSVSTHVSKTYEDESFLDIRLATLLGDHMPAPPLGSSMNKSLTKGPDDLVTFYMSLRLLLLRTPSRRSDEEQELLQTIRKSYLGYSRGSQRTEEEVAFLIVKDWYFLSTKVSPIK